jgi:hypothetical protein
MDKDNNIHPQFIATKVVSERIKKLREQIKRNKE